MNALDYVLIAIMAVAALRCWFRGLVTEVLSAAAMVGGLLAAIFFYKPVGGWISGLKPLGGFEPLVGFVAAFAVVFVVVKIVERSLRSVLENLNLDTLDKFLGLLFGAVEGLAVALVILIVLRYQPLVDVSGLLEGSFAARLLLPVVAERLPSMAAGVGA